MNGLLKYFDLKGGVLLDCLVLDAVTHLLPLSERGVRDVRFAILQENNRK